MDDPVDQLASHTLAQYAAMAQALIDAAVSADLPEPRLGTNPGWPDLQFTGSDRQMFFLDLKRRGGRLSEPQGAMRDHLVGCGFAYLCTNSVDRAWSKFDPDQARMAME
jgi:hypothetical protein